jgi:serine/threonine protein kinase
MPKCSHCSSSIAEDAAFCSSCGRPASSASQLPTIDSDSQAPSPLRRPSATPRASASSRLSSSDHGGFVPGTILVNRFRIVSLVGRGGMGEVYRADDLELGQAVALKFLPKGMLGDQEALERFRGEVRNARQIAHPNVCRVYDIGEHEGRTFLSMEYVDGEDLASLLRRIGRLPALKANELAQQICSGLAAAHSRQILHRDLKPSNILVDGRGHAHITDFGLAIRTNEDTGEAVGTPAYMAPEQFRGDPATPRTDLYALGLVLYELYTGKRPFEGASFSECRQQHLTAIPQPPGEKVRDLEPGVEAIILRCLEKDSAKRPVSAVAVSAALPGGNTLAAVLAAGETPSPDMVAASGEEGALSRSTALLLTLLLAVTLATTVYFSNYANVISLVPPGKSPDSLIDRSRELATSLGEVPPPADYAWWFVVPTDIDRRLSKVAAPRRYREMGSFYPSVLRFGYRQSPRPLESPSLHRIQWLQPAPYYSGEIALTIDMQGRLFYFSRIPPQKIEPVQVSANPDWKSFWQAAGVSPESLTSITPVWAPDVSSDRIQSWKGEMQGQPFEVHAASFQGKPVFFQVVGPDPTPSRMVEPWTPGGYRFAAALFGVLGITVILFSSYFAYRNFRSGRGDRRGVFRFAASVYGIEFVFFTLTSHHLFDIGYEWNWLTHTVGFAAAIPLAQAVYYLALEPYVRRAWPELLVSWARLLSGRFTDPLVGRDVFLGILLGSVHALLWVALSASPYYFAVRGMTPNFAPGALEAMPAFLGDSLQALADGVINGMGALSVLFLLGRLTRRKWIVAVVVCLLWAALNLSGFNYSLEVPSALLSGALLAYVMLRFGLLATIFLFFSNTAMLFTPFSLDFSRWYAGRGVLVLLVVLALAFYGMRVSLGSRPLVSASES